MTFEEYWATEGARTYCSTHEERALHTWMACLRENGKPAEERQSVFPVIPLLKAWGKFANPPPKPLSELINEL